MFSVVLSKSESKEIFDIICQNSSVSKSNQVHVMISQFFSFFFL